MTVSPTGRAWTAHCEGCSLTAYPDNGAWDIGYGHRGVGEGVQWTQEMADKQFDIDLTYAADAVREFVNENVYESLTQGQFDALADFVYNLGAGHFRESMLLRVLNMGEYGRVPDELRRWIYANGEPNAGLKARREGEVILWNGGNPLEGK